MSTVVSPAVGDWPSTVTGYWPEFVEHHTGDCYCGKTVHGRTVYWTGTTTLTRYQGGGQMTDLGLLYIREHYQVPARVGVRIRFDYPEGKIQWGKIVGSSDAYLLVDFGDRRGPKVLHPTWKVTYLDGLVAQ